MKEFALKHPILTFLLADALICGIVNVVAIGVQAFGLRNQNVETEEAKAE